MVMTTHEGMSSFQHSKCSDACSCDTNSITADTSTTVNSEMTSSTTETRPISPNPQLIHEETDICDYCYCSDCGQEKSLENDALPFSYRTTNNKRRNKSSSSYIPITKCQLRQHNNKESGIWILCGTSIYNATNYVEYHPGGINSIIRKSGGIIDCTRDMSFHSPQAIKLWKKMKIGYLVPCPGETNEILDQSEQCVIS